MENKYNIGEHVTVTYKGPRGNCSESQGIIIDKITLDIGEGLIIYKVAFNSGTCGIFTDSVMKKSYSVNGNFISLY